MPREQINELLGVIFSAENIFFVAIFIGLIALVGHFSYRFLRGLPDFEHKAQMMWGAKWYWAIVLAACAIGSLTMYLGITVTQYMTTSILVADALFWLIIALSFLFLPHQIRGGLALFDFLRPRLRGRRFDFDAWLERQRQVDTKHRLVRHIPDVVMLLVPVMIAYFAFSVYPVDREIAEMQRVLPLAETLTQQLASPLVKGVFPNPPFRQQPYELRVKVPEDTTTVQAEEVLRQTQQALSRLGEPRRWEIVVTDCGKKTFATGLYDPRSPSR